MEHADVSLLYVSMSLFMVALYNFSGLIALCWVTLVAHLFHYIYFHYSSFLPFISCIYLGFFDLMHCPIISCFCFVISDFILSHYLFVSSLCTSIKFSLRASSISFVFSHMIDFSFQFNPVNYSFAFLHFQFQINLLIIFQSSFTYQYDVSKTIFVPKYWYMIDLNSCLFPWFQSIWLWPFLNPSFLLTMKMFIIARYHTCDHGLYLLDFTATYSIYKVLTVITNTGFVWSWNCYLYLI